MMNSLGTLIGCVYALLSGAVCTLANTTNHSLNYNTLYMCVSLSFLCIGFLKVMRPNTHEKTTIP